MAQTEESSSTTRQRRSSTPPPPRQAAEGKAAEAKAEAESEAAKAKAAPGEASSGEGLARRKGQEATGSGAPEASAKAKKEESGKGSKGILQAIWAAYLSALGARPLPVQTATCVAISIVGNIFCQLFVEGSAKLDMGRIIRFGILNMVYVGPVLHFWFGFLNRQFPQPGLKGAVLRLLPDQLFMAPVFNFGLLTLLLSSGGQFTTPSLVDIRETVMSNWMIWPVANLLNFWLVPPKLQMLFGNFVALLWNVYLSSKDFSR